MKIAVIGANGQLGSDICDILIKEKHQVVPLTHEIFDITNFNQVKETLEKINIDVIINSAAFHNVEQCELNPSNAFLVNAIAASHLAEQCKINNALFIHISTDYVFDGNKKEPYIESDQPLPLNNYGISKFAGELMIRNTGAHYIIVRTSGLYGLNPCRAKGGKNFVELMLSLAEQEKPLRVVDSEFVSPTFTLDLARQIAALVTLKTSGICHATAEGSCSWYEFAAEIFKLQGIKANLSIAAPNEFAIKVKRPSYSVLENNFLKLNGIHNMGHWKVALAEYLNLRKSLHSKPN